MTDAMILTKEHRRFAEFCDACVRYRYIGLCHGPPGVGKTMSARHYARWQLVEPYFSTRPLRTAPPLEAADNHVVYCTAPVAGVGMAAIVSGKRRSLENVVCTVLCTRAGDDEKALQKAFREPDPTKLIIVDEADRLKLSGLESLRDIADHDKLGLILIGMPGIEKRLSRYPQLYSRVGFVHEFRPMSHDEVRFTLQTHWAHLGLSMRPEDFADTEAVAAVLRITGGNFRLLQRLLAQIERVLGINELKLVSKEVVEAARDSLVIGIA